MAITFGVDIGLFRAMSEGKACPKTVTTLAAALSVDASLLGMPAPDTQVQQKLTTYQGESCDT